VVTGEAIVVLAGRSSKKTDVPFTLRAAAPDADAGPTAPAATSSGGGCAIDPRRAHERGTQGIALGGIALLGAIGVMRRRRRSREP
jgi:LPXTG-motif cell wall-anchored protein